MLRGFYGAASGMVAQQRRTEMLSDNIANLHTPGYKEDKGSVRTFPEMLIHAQQAQAPFGRSSQPIGEMATGVYMQERTPDFSQGDMRETGNSTDIGLWQELLPENGDGEQGALFFAVQGEDGEERYTRNGSWTVDGEGFLTTSHGHYVLGEDGEALETGNENFAVTGNGMVMNEAGEELGVIDVRYAENANDVVKEGSGLYRLEADDVEALPTAVGDEDIAYQLQQGFLEGANVDPSQTMTELMNSYRLFESNQRVLRAYDQSMERAVNDIGRLG
ncbi:flagellar basal-body rod protein FlgG [Alteribacillus persepolensis]|uniref:Flagellar basal-body rod protein FlgG n=1 Tax=Alteribacillus persepolensis TaxID=568899 RepID=A0A1G8HA22_9BACI|nr:flagellar hook-basal body protein [Alteribacillus persepolensis]SDI03486.1 flagellar basal-body rod protein FlgG [Alteribacillus persepolensis]